MKRGHIVRAVLAVTMLLSVPLFPIPRVSTTAEAAVSSASITVTNVKKQLIIDKNTVIGENEVLYVRNGGKLYINKGVTLTVKGQLKCADGGEIYSRGCIDSRSGSSVSISGKAKLLSTGSLKLRGTLLVNKTGVIKGNGKLRVMNLFEDIKCKGIVSARIAAPKPARKDGVTTVGGIIVVNKQNDLPEDYGSGLDRDTYSAFLTMKKASGYDMTIVSGFRSYEKQKSVFEYWCDIDGYDTAITYSALPGQSEHQTGLAMDITSLKQDYGDTPEGKWLAANCWQYGFIIRYPKEKEDVTGYMYEPWHVRYLGTSTAKLVYDSKLTLEEFLGLV